MGTGARVVADPNTKIFNFLGTFLMYLAPDLDIRYHIMIPSSGAYKYIKLQSSLASEMTYHVEADNLPIGLLHLPKFHQEIPES